MLLIAGLGNVGSIYTNTRHNAGFILLDILSNHYSFQWNNHKKFNADLAKGNLTLNNATHTDVILCKPTTFMNCSGSAIQSISSFYKIPLSDIIIIHDDIDLSLGKIKHKIGGGAGGHNGIKSIDNIIGTQYHRIRVGIDRPNDSRYNISDYVLGKLTEFEYNMITDQIDTIISIILSISQ